MLASCTLFLIPEAYASDPTPDARQEAIEAIQAVKGRITFETVDG